MRGIVVRTGRLAALMLLVAGCDDSGDGGAGDAGPSVSGTTQVDLSILGAGPDAPGTHSEERAASVDAFGATVQGDVLTVTLPGPSGSSVTLRWRTGDAAIPGFVSLGSGSDAATVRVASTAGAFEDDGSGSVSVSGCPKAVGDAVSGTIDSVGVVPDAGSPRWTVQASFQVVVVRAASPALNCGTGGGGDEPDAGGGGEPSCDVVFCEDQGAGCCPARTCVTRDCRVACSLEGCDGAADEDACRAGCLTQCLEDTCGVSGGCLTAATTLWECAARNACFTSDDEDTCMREHCCEEYADAF